MTHKRHQPITPSGSPPADAPPAPADSLADAPPPPPPALPAQPPAAEAAEFQALKERYLRLAAEYENFRKRSAKERAETWVRAQAELVARLADALDDLSRFAHVEPGSTDVKTIHDGVELVERKIWKELDAAGVTRVDQTGVPFDPHVHEAVTMQPAASPPQDHMVGQVLQAGYKFGDILLRPARVVVLTWQGE